MAKNKIITLTEAETSDLDLTPKQRKFLKLYFETGNGVQSAMKVYDTDNYGTAGAIASQNLKKLKNPIKTYMESKGISIGKLVEVLSDGLSANRVISAVQTDKQATGATADFIEVPDHLTRHRFLETASRWLEVEPKEQLTPDVAVQVNIHSALFDKYGKQ